MHKIDDILKELYAIDPKLREREGELRQVVEVLLAARPNAAPDPGFVARLREELEKQRAVKPPPIRSPYYGSVWWMIRILPVGAAALLIIMLTTGGDPGAPPASPAPSMMQDSMLMMEGATTKRAPGPSVYVSPQKPGSAVTVDGVTLEVPGFVAIHEDAQGKPGEFFGASTLLQPGLNESVPIALAMPIEAGKTYRASLIEDDGDGVYSDKDPSAIDALSGEPLFMFFSVE